MINEIKNIMNGNDEDDKSLTIELNNKLIKKTEKWINEIPEKLNKQEEILNKMIKITKKNYNIKLETKDNNFILKDKKGKIIKFEENDNLKNSIKFVSDKNLKINNNYHNINFKLENLTNCELFSFLESIKIYSDGFKYLYESKINIIYENLNTQINLFIKKSNKIQDIVNLNEIHYEINSDIINRNNIIIKNKSKIKFIINKNKDKIIISIFLEELGNYLIGKININKNLMKTNFEFVDYDKNIIIDLLNKNHIFKEYELNFYSEDLKNLGGIIFIRKDNLDINIKFNDDNSFWQLKIFSLIYSYCILNELFN